VDSWQGVVGSPALRLEQQANNLPPQKTACYKMLHRASGFDRFFGMIEAMENEYKT
jgi:hypothetical protein